MDNPMPKSIVDLISEKAEALVGAPNDFDSLIDLIGDARFVLIGEASHGTHEFYRIRAQISKVLIAQRGFSAVAVEADWPDAYRVNRFVRGASKDSDSVEALSGFQRFPQWMWRNADVLDFVGWLREHNDQQIFEDRKCGFYGLDLYSLHASIEAVLAYLDKLDPEAAKRARHYYSCFEHFGKDITTYGYAAGFRMAPSCEDAVVKNLVELRRKAMDYLQRDGQVAADAYFCAEQNALVVRNAEEYYRNMFRREVSSWNLRDTHMMESLVRLANHLSNQPAASKNHRLGAQLAPGRCARDANGRARRTQSRPARARTFWKGSRVDWLHHLRRHSHGCVRLGRTGRAQECASCASGKLRSAFSRSRCSKFLSRTSRRCRCRDGVAQ